MHESPGSLQEACIDYICNNLHDVCQASSTDESAAEEKRLRFPYEDIFLHRNLSDDLLARLSEGRTLTDEMLLLFDHRHTCLRRVKIVKANVTTKGLRVLKPHHITELEAIGLENVSVNDLVGCLGEWSLLNLRLLNVANSSFRAHARFCVVVSLSKLRNLQVLNVSGTEFDTHGLDIILEDLPALENLDISETSVDDLSPLRKCRCRLKSLTMYNLRASHNEDIVNILCELTNLRHLDISEGFWGQNFFLNLEPVHLSAADLLQRQNALPLLVSLDVSGKEGVCTDVLWSFMQSHPNLHFLGLTTNELCHHPMFSEPDHDAFQHQLTITGDASEVQITEALRRYIMRPIFLQKSLDALFTLTRTFSEPRLDIIKAILPVMNKHSPDLGVQMAATACIYNLTKSEMGQKLHTKWLAAIVNATLNAMESFPSHQQLQKNALLTLCSDRILQDVPFDKYRCAELVMECLCTFENAIMIRMSVAICGILAAKISTEQTSQLGSKTSNMKRLLAIVEEKTSHKTLDITLRFTLSALWNLTDESPSTCKVFLELNGLHLFVQVLKAHSQVFADAEMHERVQAETKVLGLINNLAEVKEIRSALMKETLMDIIRHFLHSNHIDVSYFAAGILSHIFSDDSVVWEVSQSVKDKMIKELGEVVLAWEEPSTEMVAYRSFRPFFPLLQCVRHPEVQLWAVWAMQHVCSKNVQRYGSMLKAEGVPEVLQQTVDQRDCDPNVARLANKVLDLLQYEFIP